jgi:hypothetical protein
LEFGLNYSPYCTFLSAFLTVPIDFLRLGAYRIADRFPAITSKARVSQLIVKIPDAPSEKIENLGTAKYNKKPPSNKHKIYRFFFKLTLSFFNSLFHMYAD